VSFGESQNDIVVCIALSGLLNGNLKVLGRCPSYLGAPLGNAVKYFDKQKNSKIKTSQIAIQAWKADTSWDASPFLCVGPSGP
jgi:hypothetical protein